MSESDNPADTNIQFVLATLPDGRVLVNFNRLVDHIKLTQESALEFAEALVYTAREAGKGRVIIDPGWDDR